MIDLILLGVGWAVYFFVHSLLAATGPKNYIISATGLSQKAYRILYNVISAVGLLVMIGYLSIVSKGAIFPVGDELRFVSLSMVVIGVVVIRQAFKQYDMGEFLGVRFGDNNEFRRKGILNHIRHPLYSGTILIIIAMFLYSPTYGTMVTMGVTFLYLAIAIPLEERKLIDLYGDKYRRYKKEVPSIIPKIRFKKD